MPRPFDAELIAKAKEQTDLQRELYIRKHADDDYWVELARDAGITLPMYYVRPSDAAIKGTLRRLKLDWALYLEAFGWENSEHFERLNPRYSMRPLTGLLLELWDEQRRLKEACGAAAAARGVKPGDAAPKTRRYPRGVAKVRRKPLSVSQSNVSV